MDSRKRPIPGRNQSGQHNNTARPANSPASHQHAVHKTPEELARTRVVPTVKGQNYKPSVQTNRPTVRKSQNDNLEFSVAPTARNQARQYSAPSVNGRQTPRQSKGKVAGLVTLGVIGSVIGKVLLFFFTFLLVLLIVLAVSFKMIASN